MISPFGKDDRAPYRFGNGGHCKLVSSPAQVVDHLLSHDRGGKEEAASHRQGEHSRRPTKRSSDSGDRLGECGTGGDQQLVAGLGSFGTRRQNLGSK